MNEDLHVLYRPENFEELIGQDHVAESLKEFEKSGNWPHAYLMTGPSGCGKTTTARIIASKLNCTKNNLTEIDAASTSSVEDVRNLTSGLQYVGFGENPTKVIIAETDEQDSEQAWKDQDIDLAAISDSSRSFRIGHWDVVIFWISEK